MQSIAQLVCYPHEVDWAFYLEDMPAQRTRDVFLLLQMLEYVGLSASRADLIFQTDSDTIRILSWSTKCK